MGLIPGIGISAKPGVVEDLVGKYAVWATYYGQRSDNFMASWKTLGGVNERPTSIAISSNGKYVTIVHGTGYNWGGIGDILSSSDYGVSFSGLGLNYYFSSAVMSCSGKYQYAAFGSYWSERGLYRSVDYGQTWSLAFNGEYFGYVSCDATGQYVYGKGGYMYSNDFGQTWNYNYNRADHDNLIVSNTMQHQMITYADGYLYVSNDYGANWTAKVANYTGYPWATQFAISGNGKCMMCGVLGGSIMLSSDYGANWQYVNYCPTSSSSGAICESGQYILRSNQAAAYKSSDFGVTWTYIGGSSYGIAVGINR
jgi:photosystem II stability/assembly factor-like uncharacterized protein